MAVAAETLHTLSHDQLEQMILTTRQSHDKYGRHGRITFSSLIMRISIFRPILDRTPMTFVGYDSYCDESSL